MSFKLDLKLVQDILTMAAAGVDYCGLAKTSHKGFCLATLEKLMKDWPGGSYLVLKSTTSFPGESPLLAIGQNYNSRKVIGFIATEGAGSTGPGDPYLSRFPDIYSNVSVRPVVCPHLLGRYFNACNAIDNQNRMRKYDLSLEKYREYSFVAGSLPLFCFYMFR